MPPASHKLWTTSPTQTQSIKKQQNKQTWNKRLCHPCYAMAKRHRSVPWVSRWVSRNTHSGHSPCASHVGIAMLACKSSGHMSFACLAASGINVIPKFSRPEDIVPHAHTQRHCLTKTKNYHETIVGSPGLTLRRMMPVGSLFFKLCQRPPSPQVHCTSKTLLIHHSHGGQ